MRLAILTIIVAIDFGLCSFVAESSSRAETPFQASPFDVTDDTTVSAVLSAISWDTDDDASVSGTLSAIALAAKKDKIVYTEEELRAANERAAKIEAEVYAEEREMYDLWIDYYRDYDHGVPVQLPRPGFLRRHRALFENAAKVGCLLVAVGVGALVYSYATELDALQQDCWQNSVSDAFLSWMFSMTLPQHEYIP